MSKKLDRLVATRVMGYTFDPKEPIGELDKPTPRPLWLGPPKPYSFDISAAWEVVEKMRAKDSDTPNAVFIGVGDVRLVHITRIVDNHVIGRSDNDDVIVGICLAALRAVGVPESEIQEAMND